MSLGLGIPVWPIVEGVDLLDGGAGGVIDSDIVECHNVELGISVSSMIPIMM